MTDWTPEDARLEASAYYGKPLRDGWGWRRRRSDPPAREARPVTNDRRTA